MPTKKVALAPLKIDLVLISFNFEKERSAEALETGIVSKAVGRQ